MTDGAPSYAGIAWRQPHVPRMTPRVLRILRVLIALVAVELTLAGCAGSSSSSPAGPTTATNVDPLAASGPSSTVAPLPSGTAPTSVVRTTTTELATTTTTSPPAATGSFTTAEGWKYSYTVVFTTPSTAKSGCVSAAPPNHVNVKFVLTIHNDLPDREAPVPSLFIATNLTAAGTIAVAAPKNVDDIYYGFGGAKPAPMELRDPDGSTCSSSLMADRNRSIPKDRTYRITGVLGGAPARTDPDTSVAFRVLAGTNQQPIYPGTLPSSRSEADWVARYGP